MTRPPERYAHQDGRCHTGRISNKKMATAALQQRVNATGRRLSLQEDIVSHQAAYALPMVNTGRRCYTSCCESEMAQHALSAYAATPSQCCVSKIR